MRAVQLEGGQTSLLMESGVLSAGFFLYGEQACCGQLALLWALGCAHPHVHTPSHSCVLCSRTHLPHAHTHTLARRHSCSHTHFLMLSHSATYHAAHSHPLHTCAALRACPHALTSLRAEGHTTPETVFSADQGGGGTVRGDTGRDGRSREIRRRCAAA